MKLLFLLLAFCLASCSLTQVKFDPHAKTVAASTEPAFSNASSSATTPPANLLAAPTAPYQLGPGDKLDIEILGETGSRAETFVTPDSKLYFNLLPGLDVTGLSPTKLQQELETRLTQFYKNPKISVNLVEAVSQRVWVLGRVNSPGIYPLNRPLRVLDAVSLAGGLFTSRFTGTTEELADLQHSFVVRGGQMMPVDFQKLIRNGDMNQNIYLQPNDFIYLPSSLTNEVYVLGAVIEPRPVGFMNDMNLMAAIGRGLGLRPDADLTHVKVIRGSLTDPKIASVNAKDIISGKAANIRLEPGDIVFIPGAGQISAGSAAKEAVNTFVRVVAATEGGNASTGRSEPVGVNVNLGTGN
jgi:protein involved in polysaccharide export with SLBB domain